MKRGQGHHRQRLKVRGLVPVPGRVTPAQAEAIRPIRVDQAVSAAEVRDGWRTQAG